MLQEERFAKILSIIDMEKSATLPQLMETLGVSESTIRRDLSTMDKKGLLVKVHGGAVAVGTKYNTVDEGVNKRQEIKCTDKKIIGEYGAKLITDDDFVYIDAGTTTEAMLEFVTAKNATFVTNAIGHAKFLSRNGFKVYILGGRFKSVTEAIVGEEAVLTLDKYNFTKGFFGSNGINIKSGFTTPDVEEAMVKRKAMENCKERYVLADESKFMQISSVKFAEFEDATIITTNLNEKIYAECNNITII
ncbi:MAG: DeoR/GlpR family DNA-binding transcription regulator [Agathobacter sp.]|nr:DeoR/GlpR family DNA-binding transcription regulator [Agathobacter sp.]